MTQEDILRRAILNDEFPSSDEFFKSDSMAQMVPDRLKFERNAALGAWMTRASGREVNASAADWQANKDALVRGFFKNPSASNVSDEQLHSLVKTHIQTAEEAADMAANMALQGKTSFEALKEMNAKRGPSLVRPIWDNYTKDLIQRHSVLSQKLAPYRGIVDSAASKLSKEMEWSLPTTQAFQDVATQLLQVPEEDRHLVISAIGATGGATAEERASYLSKLAGAMGRMTETLGAANIGTLEQIGTTFEQLSQVPESIASALSGGVTMQGELASSKERSDALLKAKESQQAFQILTQQIRQVADSEVSPIKGDNWWSQTGIDVARMAPQVAITVANPTIGVAANLSYFRATVAAQAKQEDPSLTYQQADTIGALTAPFNAAIETVTALIPFGKIKLPFVQKWLSTATTSVKGAARNLAIRGTFSVGAEVGEEMLQAVAPLWTQELLSALDKDMPGVDWEKRMPDFSKIAAQTWGPALVFGLVGGGAASINDIKNGRALASDRDTMVATGMAPAMADQIATAAESGDWSKADSLFRQEFVLTTKATDEEKTAAVARIMEAQKAQDAFRSSSERGADELERAQTIEKAMAELSRTRVFRDAEGWAVEDIDSNDVVRFDSREDAVAMAYSRLDDNAREEAQAMAKVLEAYSSGADILELDLGKSMDLAETGETEAAMKEAAITEAMLNGMSREQAEKITWTVLGSNTLETVEGVRRVVSKLFKGAGVMDAIEEPIEGKFQAGLEQGVFTSDEAMNFVKIAAEVMRAPELLTTAQSSARGLVEAVSDIVMADTFGQRKDGRKGVAGAVTAGLKARLRRQAELSGAESKFAAFLAAFRRFFKQVFKRSRALLKARKEGTLTGDFDEFLDTLMNVDPQRRHDAAAAKEALEIAQAGNMAFSLSRAVPADASNVTEMPDGAQLVGPTSFSLQAYHGTPHKVDKFTTAKIGTGEGAQAYGWGLYFAENQEVAGAYKEALSSSAFYVDGLRVDNYTSSTPEGAALASVNSNGLERTLTRADEMLDDGASHEWIAAFKKAAESYKGKLVELRAEGNLYTVELLPDADEFLDWDKPLSEQSEKVKAALRQLLNVPEVTVDQRNDPLNSNPWVARFSGSNVAIHPDKETAIRLGNDEALNLYARSGSEAYRAINPDDESASQALAKAGIPGIRYLDGGSRGAGEGTSNYVIFDESLVKILEENGKPVSGASFSLSPQRGYLGTVASGGVIAVKVPSLAKAQHADFREIATEDDAKDFRYNPADETVYWWNPAKVSDAEKQQTADYLEGLGQTVKAHKGIKASSANFAAAHGVEYAAGSFSLTPKDTEYLAAVESGDMAKAQSMVDAAAKAAGYTEKRYHGTGESFNVFEHRGTARPDHPESLIGWFFTPDEEIAKAFARQQPQRGNDPLATKWSSVGFASKNGRVMEAYLKLRNALPVKSNLKLAGAIYAIQDGQNVNEVIADLLPKQEVAELPEGYSVIGGKYKSGSEWWGVKTPKGNTIAVVRTSAEDAVSRGIDEINYSNRIDDRLFTLGLKGRNEKRSAKTLAKAAETLRSALIARGYDSVSIANDGEGRFIAKNTTVALLPEAIKSADPVTRDESGNVIPLSQRFNPETPDIRFSLAPRSLPEVADTILAAQMKKPAFFEAFVTLARRKLEKLRKDGDWRVDKRGIASKRIGFDARMADVRSPANIEAERKFRLRSRQRELIDEGMNALTPETLAAYDQGLTTLEDQPLISAMLNDHGKLMSKTTAEKLGKLKTDGKGNAGDFDDAPRLPIAWYSKGSGIMPDVMAENLGFDSVPAFWEALRSAIYSSKTANDAFRKAREAVRKVEADALAQARKEADQWAKDEAAKAPTEKEKQMMALRTLDAILSAFPPEIRAKVGGFVKLASFSTDKAREAEITRRLEKLGEVIEEEAKKHYAAKIEKLFKRFAPKKEAGKKATGQLDPDAQELVDAARAAMGYDETRTRAELAAIDSMLAEDGITPEREIQLERQRELVQLFGDFDNAESTRLESAADALEDTATEGWAKWKLKKIMERERRTEARKALIADTGKPSIGKERDKQNKWSKTTFGKAFSALLNVSSFAELLRFEFGEKSETARKLEDQERAAAYAYEDAMQAFGDRVGDFFAELAGGRLAGEQLRFDLAQPTLTVGTGDNERTISQLQGIQALLMWQQEDGRRHMEGAFDENGKPSGKWHYGEEWVKDLESKLTPEAYQVKAFLEELYAEEYQPLNAIYRQRHGVNLPKNERYSPITVQPMQAKAGEMVDPVSGFTVTGSILTPGGLRTRNKRAVAEPRFDDAVQIFLGHSRQMEHWKAYYDFAMDAQAVLLNREVTNAVEAKGSTQAVTVLKKWVDQFAQGGSRDAQSGLEISSVYSRASGRAARVALLGRISTLLIQSTQLAAASVKMPVGSYIKRLGMLLSGNLDYTAAVNSPFIQRRYKTAPPIVQQALAGVGDAKRPGALSSTTPRILGNLLSGADALFTGGTYAIILDYHRNVTGPAMGLQGEELESFAQMEAERDTEAVAQPVRAGTRSIFENTLTSPLAKTGFAFASEARQKAALFAWSAYKVKSDPAQAAKVAFLTFIVGGLVSQVLKNLWREAKDDDDEKMWSTERLVKATIAGPLHGVPGVSELMGDPGLFSGFAWSMGGVKKIATKAMDDDLDEVTMRDMENALSAAGYFNDTAAGIAGLSHLGFDFAKILQALAEEE